MSSCGDTLKRLSVWIAIFACIAITVSHFVSLHPYGENLEEVTDAIYDHNDYCDGDPDCTRCEDLKESRSNVVRAITQIWMSSLTSLFFFIICSGVLFGIGEIADNTATTSRHALDTAKSANATAQNTMATAQNTYKIASDSK